MNAEELHYKIVNTVEKQKFYKILGVATLITAVLFPINLFINPNVDPIVFDSPIMLGFGFLAFVCMMLVLYVGGAVLFSVALDGGIRVHNQIGKFNVNSILRDDELLDRWTNGILSRTARQNKKYDDPKFDELEEKYERFNNDRMENERFYINQNLRLKDELKKKNEKINNLESRIEKLEKKDSERFQNIGDKTKSKNNNENTKFRKFKDLDE